MISGLVAGAVISGLHSLFLEPVIDRAIEIEGQLNPPDATATAKPAVRRPTQKWGLVAGFVLLGAVWGLLFGLFIHLARAWRHPTWLTARQALLMALIAGWTVAIFPFLKYPANPPGVGEPGSIGHRQNLYFGFVGLSIAGTVLALGLHQRLDRLASLRVASKARSWIAAGLYALYASGIYIIMPTNPDPVGMPGHLVWTFRAISFMGLIVFWVVLGVVFGWLHKR